MVTCQHIRAYKSPLALPLNCTVVDAALATLASPKLFKPVEITTDQIVKKRFYSASLGYNNPTREAVREAWDVFGGNTPAALILSIGAGSSPPKSIDTPMETLMHEILEDCDKLAVELSGQFHTSGIYFRLSVDQVIQYPTTDSWKPLSVGGIHAQTLGYLERKAEAGEDLIDAITDNLLEAHGQVAIGVLSEYTAPSPKRR
jgi:hypothetical protein